MNSNKKTMPLDKHVETADDLSIAFHHLKKVFFRCQEHYPKSYKIMKLLMKVLPGSLQSIWVQIQSELDSDYHKTITKEQFSELGHIYYNLDERYKKLSERGYLRVVKK